MTTATSTALSLRRLPVALGLGLTLAAGLVTTSAGSVAAAGTTVTPSGPVSIVNNNYSSRDYDPVTIPAVRTVDAQPDEPRRRRRAGHDHRRRRGGPLDQPHLPGGPGPDAGRPRRPAGGADERCGFERHRCPTSPCGFDDEAPDRAAAGPRAGRRLLPADELRVRAIDLFPAPAPDPSGAASALSVFDGTSANGIWQLFVVDDSDQDSGVIAQGWELRFETTGGSDPYPAGVTVAGAPGTVTDVDVLLNGYSDPRPGLGRPAARGPDRSAGGGHERCGRYCCRSSTPTWWWTTRRPWPCPRPR